MDGRRTSPGRILVVAPRIAALAVVATLASSVASAQDAPSFKIGARMQGWYQAVERAAADGSTAHDFMIRRGYVHMTGTLPSNVSVFAHVAADRVGQQGLDVPGLGLGTGLALRDAWIAWEPTKAFRVQMGRMYVPFTRAFGTESTFTLLTLDLPSSQGGTRGSVFYASKVGRDDGVVVWGTPLNGRLQYRIGVMEGVETTANPSDSLRFAGRLAVSLLEPEDTWFNRGTYLGTKRVFAVAVGFDRQDSLTVSGAPSFDSRSWTADVFFDHPVAAGAVTVEGGFTHVDGLTQPLPFAGLAPGADARISYLQAGYLIPRPLGNGRVQMYGRFETISSAGDSDASAPAVGANYLVRGHDLKATIEWNWLDRKGAAANRVFTIQLQVGL